MPLGAARQAQFIFDDAEIEEQSETTWGRLVSCKQGRERSICIASGTLPQCLSLCGSYCLIAGIRCGRAVG